ncbi:MAG: hypothetical protein ABI382_11255 [Nakamurella sp.]
MRFVTVTPSAARDETSAAETRSVPPSTTTCEIPSVLIADATSGEMAEPLVSSIGILRRS